MMESIMTRSPISSHLISMFTDRLTDVGGQAHVVADSDLVAMAIQEIARQDSARTIWVSDEAMRRAPELMLQLGGAGFAMKIPGSPAEVRDQPLGLAIAEGAIAETGSMIMSEPVVSSRSVSLMTETLIVVCPTSALLPSLDEAAGMLRSISAGGASYTTFITGPSRTADIERQLTIGVQGPGVLHVILVDELS